MSKVNTKKAPGSKNPMRKEAANDKAAVKFPKEIGLCADLLWEMDQKRKKLETQAEDIKKEQIRLREHIINNLPKSKASGVSGRKARVTIVIKEILQVKDWTKFYAYMFKKKSPELLQKRLSEGAVQERLEAGEDIPGVEIFKTKTVSMGKV